MSEKQPLFEAEGGNDDNAYVSINNEFSMDTEKKDYDTRGRMKKFIDFILRRKKHFARTVNLNGVTEPVKNYGSNSINNRKYHVVFFLFQFLYEQFKLFSNMYYLLTALSQLIPYFQVGYLFTYIAPLVFVLGITFVKDMFDDLLRFKRDMDVNMEKYEKITKTGEVVPIRSHKIRVGDLIKIKCDQRVPCDCLLIQTTEKTGSSFIRTSSLDGETDWKLRHTIPYFQKQELSMDVINSIASFYVEAPKKDIYDFFGRCTFKNSNQANLDFEPLNLQNTLWANTHIATGDVIGLAIYVGDETRSVLNKQDPTPKTGKVDKELNNQMKLLFVIMFILSLASVLLKKQFEGIILFFATFVRYIILFSSIIPISLKVNMDLSKSVYSFIIGRDKKIKGAVVRNSSIPEELGRIDHLFCDKTGTLTQNEMIFKRLCLGGDNKFSNEKEYQIKEILRQAYEKGRKKLTETEMKIRNIMVGIALCHNVTPCYVGEVRKYEASSPDEQSLVSFAEGVGLILTKRDLKKMVIQDPTGTQMTFDILLMFPFTSAAKRMGIFVRKEGVENGKVLFLMKGADVVMRKVIKKEGSEWLSEDCDDLAREGLRTLVFAQKVITTKEFNEFDRKYKEAKASLTDRKEKIQKVRAEFEKNMDLIGLTGVEDLLQEDVAKVLEDFKHAGINCWMLTGDKVETAICIARSTRLISRQQEISQLIAGNEADMEDLLAKYQNEDDNNLAIVLDGNSLKIVLDGGNLEKQFVKLCNTKCSSVVVARCAPTQKAQVVKLVKKNSKNITTAAIGDGGNDVSMILEAHVGVGIVGKEGKQASLAADFSINQFSHLRRLVLWHGTNSYRRAAKMSQFIIHRGMIISIIQLVFSAIYFFATIPIFTGMLLVGYSTFYTVLPVFAICMDTELSENVVSEFPEIYKSLQKHKLLSFRAFLVTTWKACYQGGVIMLIQLILAVFFVSSSNLLRMQSIAYTALIFTELIMIGLTSFRLNLLMVASEILSILIYVVSILVLPTYFDINYVFSLDFLWKTILIVAISTLPIYLSEFVYNKLKPSQHSKLSHKRESVKNMINQQLLIQV